MELYLNNIDYDKISDKPAVYQIKNIITGRALISSTTNLRKHLKNITMALDKSLTRLPQLLVDEYKGYGAKSYVVEVFKEKVNETNKDKIKERIMSNSTRLYNIKMDLSGGGYEMLSEPCYLLNLRGEIVKEFPSIQSAFKSLDTTPHYSGKNTSSIVSGKYRIVTKEFYKYNASIVQSWTPYTDLTKYMSYIYKKSVRVSANIDGKLIIFENVKVLAQYLNKTKEAIRLVLRGETKANPYDIKYIDEESRKEFQTLRAIKDSERNRKRKARLTRK